MKEPTILESLQASKAKGSQFAAEVQKVLAAAGLEPPVPDEDRERLLAAVKAQVPAVHWLLVGEKLGDVERRDVTGRWTTTISCHYDRVNHIVVEHHVRGKPGDYDYAAWANVQRLVFAAKADAAWARLAKRYRFDAGVGVVAAKPAAKSAARAAPAPAADALLEQYWNNPDDTQTLQVLADSWAQAGDPRGEFVQLSLLDSPTVEQKAARDKLLKKAGGKLVGPAREYLREWAFGANGLVERARCEADKLAAGIDLIGKLNPRLCLSVTSLKKRATIDAVSKVSLARVHFIDFTQGVMGTHGAINVSDQALRAIAPAFRGVVNLSLSACGHAADCFSPDGLRAFADHLDGIEYFALDYFSYPDDDPLRPLDEYVAVVASHPAFRSVRAVLIEGADRSSLRGLPRLVTVITEDTRRRRPSTASELAALEQPAT